MTALEALAWTLPPSAAAAWCFWLDRNAAEARKLALQDQQLLEVVADTQRDHSKALRDTEAELKRQAEQISLLADRYR